MLFAQLLASFQSLPLLPRSKLGLSGADSQVVILCTFQNPVGLSNERLGGWEFLLPPQHPQVFSVIGFEALFPHAGTLGCVVCLVPQLFLPFICMQMWDCLVHQPPP